MDLQKLYSYTRKAIYEYDMIEDGDKVAIGISGGKDSLTLLYALAGLKHFYPKKYELVAITVKLGLENMDFTPVKELCDKLEVPYYTVDTEIYQIIFEARKESNPCSLCAKMRKGAFNEKALELGCNKFAYAHHRDDLIETFYMSLMYEGRIHTFSPVTYNPIYDVDDCKLVRITLTGNIQSPSRYSSLLQNTCDVGLIGYYRRQVLYGDEYVEIEIDKNNNRWRQVKSGYSMFYRSSHLQNWSDNKPESYESECRCLWSNIPNGTVRKICMINNKVCYSFSHLSNPSTLLLMGCKIKIEKLA